MDGAFDENGFINISNGDNIKQNTELIRVHPSESFINNFSNNYDPDKYWKNKVSNGSIKFSIIR
jgi:hypothetical protein